MRTYEKNNQQVNVDIFAMARWAHKIDIIQAGLELIRPFWVEGWGEGGQDAYDALKDGEARKDESLSFQRLKLQGLDRMLPSRGRQQAFRHVPEIIEAFPATYSPTGRLSWVVERCARVAVLEQVGLINNTIAVGQKVTLPVAAVALGLYYEKDISNPVSRRLWDHELEIELLIGRNPSLPIQQIGELASLFANSARHIKAKTYHTWFDGLATTLDRA